MKKRSVPAPKRPALHRTAALLLLAGSAAVWAGADTPPPIDSEFSPQRPKIVLASGQTVETDKPSAARPGPSPKTAAEQIDEHSRREAEALPTSWLGDTLSVADLVRETDEFWAGYLKSVAQQPSGSDAAARERLARQKNFLRSAWLKKRETFLAHHDGNAAALTLRRFDGGAGHALGYALIKDGKPCRSLTLFMHRPDAALGGAEPALPLAK